jgi:hypothetical protein
VTDESTPPDMATTTRVSCGDLAMPKLLRAFFMGRTVRALISEGKFGGSLHMGVVFSQRATKDLKLA